MTIAVITMMVVVRKLGLASWVVGVQASKVRVYRIKAQGLGFWRCLFGGLGVGSRIGEQGCGSWFGSETDPLDLEKRP